jgi:hypothetical protein
MSPSYFAVRNAELDEQIEAARLAGDFPRVYELLAEQISLVRAMYGAACQSACLGREPGRPASARRPGKRLGRRVPRI